MKKISCACLLSLTLIFYQTGCVSNTMVDFDEAALATIENYQCFEVTPRKARTDYQDVVLSPIVDRRIERALIADLGTKGYTQECSQADFRVTFNTVTKTKTEVRPIGPISSPYRRGRYCGYYFDRHRFVDVDQYEEGTFIVDIIDKASNELVWRGTYAKRLGWSAPTEDEIRNIISDIMATFPSRLKPKPH